MAVDIKELNAAAGNFGELGVTKQLVMMIALAASVALGVYVVLWSREPDMTPLYAHLDAQEASTVVEALEKSDIYYSYDSAKGMIIVPQSKVHEVRMKLASQGLPKGTGVGYELLDKPQGFGTSQFMESVRFRRSLEGELSRTISSLDDVQSARVHLGLPRQSSFLRRETISSASVMIDIANQTDLSRDQVMGVVHLVASSVPGLKRDNVTVVNQFGHLLTNQGKSDIGVAMEELAYVKQKEEELSQKIKDILTPIYGLYGVRAKVSADFDFTSIETTSENYDNDKSAVRSEAIVKESRRNDVPPEGVPGALSNEPPAISDAPETLDGTVSEAEQESQGTPTSERNQETRNYEVDKSITHTRHSVGNVKRISVAIVIDDKTTYNDTGDVIKTPLTEEELLQVEKLVKDAVGINQERGDQISVVNTQFAKNPPISAPEAVPFFEQAWIIPAAKQALAAIFILILIFSVIRPTMRQLIEMRPPLPKIEEEEEEPEDKEKIPKLELPPPDHLSQQRVDHVKQIAHQDSKKAAQVVMNWVGKEDE